MSGLIHIYCGDGKGKTTAAVGLAVRAAGAGRKVVFAQFFKNGSSSEIGVLSGMSQVKVDICPKKHGFFKNMDEEERGEARCDYGELLDRALADAADAGLLVLDEIISACNHDMVCESLLLEFLKSKPEELEVVLTGREPSDALLSCADYVTEMRKVKHPYDRGVKARKGIEF